MNTKNTKNILLPLVLVFVLVFTVACNNSAIESSSEVSSSLSSVESTPESSDESIDSSIEPTNISFLPGPTGIGAVFLLQGIENKDTEFNYNYTISASAEEVIPKILNGEFDIAAVPTNVASTLYNKSEGEVVILAVNNFGAFKILSNDESIISLEDLKGKTIVLAGQGATPEYALKYVLEQNGINPETDLTLEFRSEIPEVATAIIAGESDIVLLPEPFVTQVLKKSETAKEVIDISKEWKNVSDTSTFTVGCIVARKDFVESNPNIITSFLTEYEKSINLVLTETEKAAELCEQFGIQKADVAIEAIPNSNIAYIDSSNGLKEQVSGYLEVLHGFNPQSVGGKLPGDDFYFEK